MNTTRMSRPRHRLPRTNPRRSFCVFLGALSVFVAESQQSRASADQFDPIRQQIKTALVESNLPSVSVAVARDGAILWEEGFGWADRENRIAATEHTMYSLASISKPITATGLMTLVERARVKLDKRINEYLGSAKLTARIGDANNATVRRVANHTSGLPLHYQFFYEDEPYRRPTMDETIRRYGNLLTRPGERYQYSNLGFGVLDYVIARESGKSYADYMRQKVFLPLGMTHTSVDIGPGLEKHHAIRYDPTGDPIPFYDFDHPGASAIYSSAHDLVRFGMFHLKNHLPDQKAILSDKSIDAMQQATSEPGKDTGYGIGWGMSVDGRGYRTVSHSGGMGGVSTLLVLVPEENIAVASLANARTPLAYRLPGEILKILLPDSNTEQSDRKNAQQEAETDESQDSENAWPPSPLVGRWKGKVHTYQGELRLRFDVKPEGRRTRKTRHPIGDTAERRADRSRLSQGPLSG